MPRKPYKPSFGSISTGTMRPADLIPAFANELEACITGSETNGWTERCKEFLETVEALSDYESDDASEILESLFEALNTFAPDYGYFGAHPGDGADYGYWLPQGFERDFEGLKVSDTSEVPADYEGDVLHVNDHGNCTLYSAHNGGLTEIWSVV